MSKKVISAVIVLSIISISVFASYDGSEFIGIATSGNLELGNTYDPTFIPPDSGNITNDTINNDPISINELWDNIHAFYNRFDDALYTAGTSSSYNNIGTNIRRILDNFNSFANMFSPSNGGGYFFNLFSYLVDTQHRSNIVNLYDLKQVLNYIEDDVDGLENNTSAINNNLLTTSGAVITIRNAIQNYLADMHSDLMGLNRMFSSAGSGGAYYNQLIASGGALENIESSSSNSAIAVAGIRTDLIDYLTYTDALNNSGLSVFKDRQGHNFLNGIDSATTDLLNYFYDFFIDDDMPTSTNGGEAIVGLYNNSNSIVSGYGYNSNSTLASAISNISSKEDSQITELQNIVDVLANQNDTNIISNQTNNTTTVSQRFFNGTSSDTSLGTQDFIDLGNILTTLRQLFNPNLNLSGFGTALQDGITAGQSFFSQEVYNDLNGVTG